MAKNNRGFNHITPPSGPVNSVAPIAKLIADYYEELRRSGFDDDQAMELTKDLQARIIGAGFEMHAAQQG